MPVATYPTDVLCVYDLPNDEELREHLRWLSRNQNRHLVILHEGIASLPEHERVLSADVRDKESLKAVAWALVFLEFTYKEEDSQKAHEAMMQMRHFHEGVHLVASDFAERGLDKLRNYLHNEKSLARSVKASGLFGKFKDVPAVICGAGFSLEENAQLVQQMQDRALIFGGGTTLAAMAKLEIHPHFAALLDPHPPTSRHLKIKDVHVPTFFQTRAHPKLLQKMQGPLLWVPGSEHDCFDEEQFDAGWNVSTFLTSLACSMGCNPIILVGVDLAQSKHKAYAGDLPRSEGGELIALENGMYSRKDWLFAGHWLSELAAKHQDVEWINASKGLKLEHFEHRPLDSIDLEPISGIREHIEEATGAIKDGANVVPSSVTFQSLQKVSSLIDQLLGELEAIFPAPVSESPTYASLKEMIEGETVYQRFLAPVWSTWKHVFARQLDPSTPPEYGIMINQWLFMKGICDEARQL